MSDAAPVPAPAWARVTVAVVFAVLLAGFVAFALMLDVFAAGAATAQARAFQIGIAFTASVPALALVGLARRRWMRTAYLVTGAAMLALFFVPWHPRKRFTSDLFSLEPGMTVDEVEIVMGQYLKGAGTKWVVPDSPAIPAAYPSGNERAHATGTMTYRWNDFDSSYDSDWGQVTFRDGRVVSVQFLPD